MIKRHWGKIFGLLAFVAVVLPAEANLNSSVTIPNQEMAIVKKLCNNNGLETMIKSLLMDNFVNTVKMEVEGFLDYDTIWVFFNEKTLQNHFLTSKGNCVVESYLVNE